MSGDNSNGNRFDEFQLELNRQALLEITKRLAELEQKFWDLDSSAKDLKFFSETLLDTSKRLQMSVSKILEAVQAKKSAK